MKEEPVVPRSETVTYKERVDEFLRSRRDKMFGVAEVVGLVGSCFVLTLVLLSYVYFLVPARLRLSTANAEKVRLEINLKKLTDIVKDGRNTGETVGKIEASLIKFETSDLPREEQGRMALYQELNELILKNNLRNTSGPSYAPLDPAGTKATPGKSMSSKWQSYYPGVSVTVTVEGPYQSVRHFIQDVERSKQFIVINEVELQRATENNSAAAVEGESGSGTRASMVSLQLSLATYFRRDASDGSTPTQGK
jgi:hypothetical protein